MNEHQLNGKAFYKYALRVSLPIALQLLLTRAVDASDTLMLGILSQDALSAVSLATQIQFILNMLVMAINSVVSAMGAQYWGKGDSVSTDKTLAFSLKISGGAALLFFMATLLAPGTLMRCFTDDPNLIRLGVSYLRIAGLSYLFMGISQPFLMIMKATGRIAKSSAFASTAVVLNLILNALLIYGLIGLPRLGILGAAIATVISRGMELFLCVIESTRVTAGKFRLSFFLRDDRPIRLQFLRLLPAVLLNMVVWSLGQTMFSVIMGHLGSDAVAANSLASVVRMLLLSFSNGIGNASSVIVGHELGADHLETARIYAKRLVWLAVGTGTAAGCILALIAPLIVSLSPALTDTSHTYLRIMLYMCSFYVIGRSTNTVFVHGCFYAGGDTRFGLICDGINIWCFIIPLASFLAFVVKAPVLAVYAVLTLDEIVKIPPEVIHFRKYKWLRNITKEL